MVVCPLLFPQGSGENKMGNKGLADAESIVQSGGPLRTATERMAGAFGNGKYGPQAFQMVDQGLFDDIQRMRDGRRALEPVDKTPAGMRPAFTPPSNPKRGTEG